MFAASNHTARFLCCAFAALMALAIHGSVLMEFDSVATATGTSSTQARDVAVLETVTIVGHRI